MTKPRYELGQDVWVVKDNKVLHGLDGEASTLEEIIERDPKALPYLQEFLALPNYREIMGYTNEEQKKLS